MEIVENIDSVHIELYAASETAREGVGKSPGHTQMGEMLRISTEDAHCKTRRHIHTDASLSLPLKCEDDNFFIIWTSLLPNQDR